MTGITSPRGFPVAFLSTAPADFDALPTRHEVEQRHLHCFLRSWLTCRLQVVVFALLVLQS